MKLHVIKYPFPHVVINDYFTEEELKRVWKELNFLTQKDKLQIPEKTGTARNEDGTPKKRNSGLFLDEVYSNRDISDILKFGRKIFDDVESRKIIANSCWELKPWLDGIGRFTTLVSYYEDSDYYKPHKDIGFFTTLVHLFTEPKHYTGGELYFPEFDFTVPTVYNRMFIFPSQLEHQVNLVKMNNSDFSGYGRYTITQLCSSF